MIQWIIRLFIEAREWKQGVEFICVAFQNRVAHAMSGFTLHSAGDIKVGSKTDDTSLEHWDIDGLCTRNQALRWILIDELLMIPEQLPPNSIATSQTRPLDRCSRNV